MKNKIITAALALALAAPTFAAKIDEDDKEARYRYSELVKVEAAMLRYFIDKRVDYVTTTELQQQGYLYLNPDYKIENVRFGSTDENLATRYALRMTGLTEAQGQMIADRCNLRFLEKNMLNVSGVGETLNKCLFDPSHGELIYFYKDDWP